MKLLIITIISLVLNGIAFIIATFKDIEPEIDVKIMLGIVLTFVAWVLYENFFKNRK